MKQFVSSDYVDKEGNVYETVGENIREGKNGAVTSEFPTPEEIGVGGLVGSDGKNYTVALKNLANTSLIKGTYNLLRYNSRTNIVDYVSPNTDIKDAGHAAIPPTSQGVINYIDAKLPYLKNAKTGIVVISISEKGTASILENESNLNIYAETGSNTLRILCKSKNKNVIDLKLLKCTTDSASNFNVTVNTLFSVGNNSLFKEVYISNIKTITLLLSVEV